MFHQHTQHVKGFTLIEVLIAFIILSFGLLGAVALQAKAKQASFDALQRAAAVALGNDILQRIRANDTTDLVSLYHQEFTSSTAPIPSTSCFSSSCSASSIAKFDTEQWKRAIRAREHTGSLDNATVCINPKVVAGTGGRAFDVQVVVSWLGRQSLTANTATTDISCGTTDKKRRLVVLNSYIYARS